MANRASFVALHATSALGGPIRASFVGLLFTGRVDAPERISLHDLSWTGGLPGPIRISDHTLAYTGAMAATAPVRASGHYFYSVQSINNAFFPILLESGEIFGITKFTVDLSASLIPEFNPYKPQVPESLIDIPGAGRDFFDYIEENQKTLRLQHNITQAGDTTFPYQMVISAHDEQQFTLGSVGKFYHEDYGLIHARYVQYEKMNPALTACSPVGLITQTAKLDWIVTNRLEISDPNLVVGIQAAYIMPSDGQFGWVIMDGVNLQQIPVDGTVTEVGTPYAWSSSGKVGPDGEGVVICRRLQEGGSPVLFAGAAYIRLEGSSFASIDAHYSQLIADVEQLKIDIASLQESSDVDAAIKKINQTIKVLGQRLTIEENTRKQSDISINNRIDGLNFATLAQLNGAIALLRSEILAITNALQAQVNVATSIANEALAAANQALSVDIAGLQTQISTILDWMASEAVRPKGKFPLVDGAVPPNLVYLDDGSLVYLETF